MLTLLALVLLMTSLNTKDENKITQRKLVQMQAGRCNSLKTFEMDLTMGKPT